MRYMLLATTCIAAVTAATPSLAQAAYPCYLMVLDGVDGLAAVHKVYSFPSARAYPTFSVQAQSEGSAFSTL